MSVRSWPTKKLEEVCEIIVGQSPPGETYRKQPEGLPFFQGKADFGLRSPVARTWCVDPKKVARPGDILISVRAPVGPTNIAEVECCIGRGLAAIRSKPNVADRHFVHAFLRHIEPQLSKTGVGSIFAAINRNDLEAIEIPLPPLDEQRRIVEKLDAQMKEVERMRAAVDVKIEAARALPSSFLRTVFTSPESQTWPVKNLGEVCDVSWGDTSITKRSYVSQGYTAFSASGPDGCLENFEYDRSGIVLSAIGARCGKCFLANGKWTAIKNTIVIFPKDESEIDTRFLIRLLDRSKDWPIDSMAQPFITMSGAQSVDIPVPPLSDQRRIVVRLDAQMAHANALIRALESERGAIAALPAALLREVFE